MKKLRNKLTKAFTIVELVIVIAVIAILASVLIPTFSNVIAKAKVSQDVSLAKTLNTVLITEEQEPNKRIPGSIYDVLYLENYNGLIIENLNPTAEGKYYAWDQKKNRILYIDSDLETVLYPEETSLTPSNCWITISTAEEAQTVTDKGFNIAFENDISETITLHNTVSVNTLGYTCANLVMTDGDNSAETAYLTGKFGETQITSSKTIITSGTVSSLNVSGSGSISIGGSVSNYTAGSGVTSTISQTGLVSNITSGSTGSITNNGVVKSNSSSTVVTGKTSTENNEVSASTKEDLESIRTQVSSGARSFEDETVKLSEDINLNGIAFTPIANISREGISASSTAVFKGTFDGNGYEIKNFSTSGFSLTGLNAGTNSSTPAFGASKNTYNEAVYGLFGVTYDAYIKNLSVTCSINMVLDHSNNYVGDSVGGIVGCAYGTITFENCTVSGTINGYDGVGGFLGRLKGSSATFINCTNNANVTGVRKTGGFIGSSYSGNYSVTYTNCVNNGNITSQGVEKDIELGCWSGDKQMTSSNYTVASSNYTGYYTASASNGEYASHQYVSGSKHKNVVTNNGFTNNGIIKVGSVEVGDGTYMDATDGKCKYNK